MSGNHPDALNLRPNDTAQPYTSEGAQPTMIALEWNNGMQM